MAERSSDHLSADERERIRAAEHHLADLLRSAEQAHAEGRLAEMIRDTPSVHEQLRSLSGA